MNKTTIQEPTSDRGCVNIADLMQFTGCGRYTAEKIAKAAGARIKIGKRVLYNLSKVSQYLDAISE